MRSQAKSSGVKLSEVHGVGRGLGSEYMIRKQIVQPLVLKVKVQEITQVKPRFKQGRAEIRCKKPQINHPIGQLG